jgi:phosphate transport system ATP-binding protein
MTPNEQLEEPATATAAAPGTRDAMRVEDVRVRAGKKELLRGVTAEFPANEVSAIIGPTGCGKTTLLRTLNRMHDGSSDLSVSGQVMLGDRDIYTQIRNVRELRRRVGMVFQRPNPFPVSILENLTIGPHIHGLAGGSSLDQVAESGLKEVGLWEAVKDRLKTSPFSLSGGQQQLLCIARALSVSPEVLLLDEPTSSLDPITTGHIEDLISELSNRVTVIMVSHNLAQVARVADNVLLLMMGSRVEFADSQTFFHNPSDPRTREYIAGEATLLQPDHR